MTGVTGVPETTSSIGRTTRRPFFILLLQVGGSSHFNLAKTTAESITITMCSMKKGLSYTHASRILSLEPWFPTWGVFIVPASASRLHKPWYVASCLWDDAYERTLAANLERVAHVAGFLSRCMCGTLPYVWRHITVNKMCWVRR